MTLKQKVLRRLQELELQPKRSMGQNFLIGDHIVARVIDKLKSTQGFEQIIEVGPGLGSLTDELETLGKDLLLIEYDDGMARYWQQDRGHSVIHQNALEVQWHNVGKKPWALVSNLPYQIGSRLFVDLSFVANKPELMILMFQKEVAESLYGQRQKGDISLLSLVRESFWHSQFLLEAGSIDFMPRPRVASQIVCFHPKPVEPSLLNQRYLRFLKTILQQKKKKMITNLRKFYNPSKIEEAYQDLKLSENSRVHELTLDQLQRLYRFIS